MMTDADIGRVMLAIHRGYPVEYIVNGKWEQNAGLDMSGMMHMIRNGIEARVQKEEIGAGINCKCHVEKHNGRYVFMSPPSRSGRPSCVETVITSAPSFIGFKCFEYANGFCCASPTRYMELDGGKAEVASYVVFEGAE
jgi:hypothetical protein